MARRGGGHWVLYQKTCQTKKLKDKKQRTKRKTATFIVQSQNRTPSSRSTLRKSISSGGVELPPIDVTRRIGPRRRAVGVVMPRHVIRWLPARVIQRDLIGRVGAAERCASENAPREQSSCSLGNHSMAIQAKGRNDRSSESAWVPRAEPSVPKRSGAA